jgi:hypothetical protein
MKKFLLRITWCAALIASLGLPRAWSAPLDSSVVKVFATVRYPAPFSPWTKQLANIWMILNVGGGPTPDKPTVTLSVPAHINSFMNFRVADIQACYELWKSRGAEFITEPIPKYGETRCYIRDPDGYIIEVGQSTDLAYG